MEIGYDHSLVKGVGNILTK